MTEYENMSQVWAQRPEGGTEGELIKVGGDTYKWNNSFRNWLLYEEAYKQTTLDGDLNVNRHITAGGNMTVKGNGTIEGDLTVKGKVNFDATGADIDKISGDLTIEGTTTIKKNLKVEGKVEAESVNTPFLGLFSTVESLKTKYPTTTEGNYAIVGNTIPGPIYRYGQSGWQATGETGGGELSIDLSDYYTKGETYSRKELYGKVMGAIILTKTANDYSELDKYGTISYLGKWAVYYNDITMLVGYLNVYLDFAGNIVQELNGFMIKDGASSALTYTTRMTRSKALAASSWSAWKTYQSSFIGSNTAFDEENSVPSIKMFNDAVKYKKIVEWNGSIITANSLNKASVDESDPSNIYFAQDFGRFVYFKAGTCYENWITRSDYVNDDGSLTKNIFKTTGGLYYIATDKNQITGLSERRYELPKDIREVATGSPSELDSYLGDAADFANAIKNGYLITSNGLVLQVFKVQYNMNMPSVVNMLVIYNSDTGATSLKYRVINVSIINGESYSDRNVTEYSLTTSA